MVQATRLHLVIEGRVQGVGFRYFVAEQAQGLGVVGWVRNRWDGSVEVMAEGETEVLESFLAQVRRGPRSSYVSDVKISWEKPSGGFNDFRVVATV